MDAPLGSSLPTQSAASILRLVVFLILSIMLIALDQRGQHLAQIRATLSVLTYPIQVIAAAPVAMARWVGDMVGGDAGMRADYEKLKSERPQLMAKLQQYEALQAENHRLRNLLNAAQHVADRALVTELLEVHTEPFTRKVIVKRGQRDNVYAGQPAIDAHGLIGQVTHVGLLNSTVTLITDPGHAVPVLVNRNGLRTIAVGTGDSLTLPYLSRSSDVKEGDLLVTSGMGGGFPPGYPVAKLSRIVNDPDEPFLQVTAQPAAQLEHNKEILLIWPGTKTDQTFTSTDTPKP